MRVTKIIRSETGKQDTLRNIVFTPETLKDEGYIEGLLVSAVNKGDLLTSDIKEIQE